MLKISFPVFALVFSCAAALSAAEASPNTNVTVDSAGSEPFALNEKTGDEEKIVFYKDGDWTVDFRDSKVGPRLDF